MGHENNILHHSSWIRLQPIVQFMYLLKPHTHQTCCGYSGWKSCEFQLWGCLTILEFRPSETVRRSAEDLEGRESREHGEKSTRKGEEEYIGVIGVEKAKREMWRKRKWQGTAITREDWYTEITHHYFP